VVSGAGDGGLGSSASSSSSSSLYIEKRAAMPSVSDAMPVTEIEKFGLDLGTMQGDARHGEEEDGGFRGRGARPLGAAVWRVCERIGLYSIRFD
jgi:hypothetical protein